MSTPPPEQPTFSHSGQRYLLGYTSVEYGIWDRQTPGPPVRKFPKSEAGWSEAWGAYQSMEGPATPAAPAPVASPSAPTTPIPSAAPAAAAPAAAAPTGPPRAPFKLTGKLVAQVLVVAGWALLVLFPLAGIGLMVAAGSSFYTIMQGLASIAFGPALWGICQTLAGVARRHA